LFKEASTKPLDTRIQDTIAILKQSYHDLRQFTPSHTLSMKYLEGVAGTRFAMMEIASFLYSRLHSGITPRSYYDRLSDNESKLLQLAKNICTDSDINRTHFTTSFARAVGPGVYLLKLLLRQFGLPFLKQVSVIHVWVMPECLRTADLVSHFTTVLS